MIGDDIQRLLLIEDQDWVHYAFQSEQLADRLSASQRKECFIHASKCGVELAKRIKAKYPGKTILECVAAEGVKVEFSELESYGTKKIFATFTEPNEITIRKSTSEKADKLIRDCGLNMMLFGIRTFEVLLAHEFFHYLESRNPDIYTQQKHLVLFKVWRFEYKKQISCLQEIGAMAFAKEFLELSFLPYLYDVLMLWVESSEDAKKLYENMKGFVEGG